MPAYEWCQQEDGTFRKCTEQELKQRLEESGHFGLYVALVFRLISGITIGIVLLIH